MGMQGADFCELLMEAALRNGEFVSSTRDIQGPPGASSPQNGATHAPTASEMHLLSPV